MFNFTPPRCRFWHRIVLLVVTCTLLLTACTWRKRSNNLVWVDNIPALDSSVFYSREALMFFARRAYLEEDPAALAVMGTSSFHLHYFDKAALDSLPAVPLEEAEIMLLHSAELGYDPAFLVIHFLDQMDLWKCSVPEYNYDSLATIHRPVEEGDFKLRVKH